MIVATRYDLELRQGSDYERVLPALDQFDRARNLVGWRAQGVIVSDDSLTAETLYEMPITLQAGRVIVKIPGTVSVNWTWRSHRYTITLTGPNDERERFAHGFVVVWP